MESLWSTFRTLSETIGDVEAILAPGRKSLRFGDLPGCLLGVRDALAELGIGRGDRIAGVLPNGPKTAVCFLGVAACATYIPLNPNLMDAEFANCLGKLRPKAVIVPAGSGGVARRCAEAAGIAVIDLVSNPEDAAGSFSLLPSPSVPRANSSRTPEWNSPEDVALVFLTSGSTGEPKAIPRRVRHLLIDARDTGRHFGLGPNDRCLHIMPMVYAGGLKTPLLTPLANGCGVICLPNFDIPSFFQEMKELKPTWYSAAASIHTAILARVGEYRDIARNARLRFISASSSRLDPKIMAGLEEAFGAPVLERYALSETGILSANCLPPGKRKPGTVGRPIGKHVAIIDENGNILGPNCEGEIAARGLSVFDGYFEDPEADNAAFINGWFRTGDLGRFDDEGYLVVTGRIKDLINRGGEKIRPVEIEKALLAHPAVREVCAFGIAHPSLGEEVAAAVVASRAVTESELRAFARSVLRSSKVPKRIFFLPSFPKGQTHKIRRDRTAEICLDLLATLHKARRDGAVPQSPLEHDIARLWTRLLGVDEIDKDDDFFLVGGDSLKAYELIARLRKSRGITLTMEQFFSEASTIAGMARVIERAEQRKENLSTAKLVALKPDGDRPPLFAVPAGEGNPIIFARLSRLLDPRQPLVGISARSTDGGDRPFRTMEDIAADNVSLICKRQPDGPYYLTGYCHGARVAYEMARQLEGAGKRVGLLVMLDASPPVLIPKSRRHGKESDACGESDWRTVADIVVERMKWNLARLGALRTASPLQIVRRKMMTLRNLVRIRAVLAANRHAGRFYKPGPFAGPVKLCISCDPALEDKPNRRLNWLELIPQVGTPVVIGTRYSNDMLSLPAAFELAGVMNRWLEDAHAERAREASGQVAAE